MQYLKSLECVNNDKMILKFKGPVKVEYNPITKELTVEKTSNVNVKSNSEELQKAYEDGDTDVIKYNGYWHKDDPFD